MFARGVHPRQRVENYSVKRGVLFTADPHHPRLGLQHALVEEPEPRAVRPGPDRPESLKIMFQGKQGVAKDHARPGAAHYGAEQFAFFGGKAAGGTIFTGRFGAPGTVGQAAGGVKEQLAAAVAEAPAPVAGPAVDVQHLFQRFYLNGDVFAHPDIICKS